MMTPWRLPIALFCLSSSSCPPAIPQNAVCFPGKTPKLDGVISPGEWTDATEFFGVSDWIPQFSPTTDPKDLALRGAVKHDGKRIYFVFDVTDDVLYAIDTPRWLPEKNPKAHELTREGYPWFGDEMELLINATNTWKGNENAVGNGASWQMVCNLTKSRLGGVGKGGLMEGEPRSDPKAWATYQQWIKSGAQQCAAKPKPNGKGYILEWSAAFDPCFEIKPGVFYSTSTVACKPKSLGRVRLNRYSAPRPASASLTVCPPHAAKLYEGRDLLRRGVREIDFTLNIGKMLGRQFQYVETELLQMAKSCAESGAKLKVDLGARYLDRDLKIIALKICKRIEAQFVSVEANLDDLALLSPLLKERIAIKVATNTSSLAEILALRSAGAARNRLTKRSGDSG